MEIILGITGPEWFSIAFGVVALFTGKDLAWYCFGGSLLSMFVSGSTMPYESQILSYSIITVSVALCSCWHFWEGRNLLSLMVSVICCFALINQAAQFILWSKASYFISNYLGLWMVLSLIFVEGHKGLVNDFVQDARFFLYRIFYGLGSSRNGKDLS